MTSLSDQLLDAAREHQRKPPTPSWRDRLAPEHRAAAEDAREKWIAAGGVSSGIAAKALATEIIRHFRGLGYQMPNPDAVRKWLTQD
jgi:hypothetical protein